MNNKSKKIILVLVCIAIISLFLKLYTFDFSIPVHFDNLKYSLDALQYSQGDYFISQKKNPGWPLFISPFYMMINSENFMDYSNLIRILSISVSTISIIPMYLLAKRFFNEKFSLVAVALFAFEPHLNYISGQGMSESLFILVFILSIYFILKQEIKYIYLSFILAGVFWWIRLEGFYLIIILSIIYFINYKNSKYSLRNFSICIILFLIVVSPMFIQRDIQYGDPFYVWYGETLFSENYGILVTSPDNASVNKYLEENNFISFLDRFIVQGAFNIVENLVKISFPYLIILIPFGLMFSLRPVGQKIGFIKSNWIIILTTLAILLIPFSTIADRRFLFPLFPFLIIFATIPIQRVVEYGLSTFSFSQAKKNYFLIIVGVLILILGTIFTLGITSYGYGAPDTVLQNEEIQFTEFLYENLDGRLLHTSNEIEFLKYIQVIKLDEGFKSFESFRGKNPYPDTYSSGKLTQIWVYGNSMEELIENGKKVGLKYISYSNNDSYFFPFFKDNFSKDDQIPYLNKIIDAKELGYKKLQTKIFEIDYKEFDLFQKTKLQK